MSVVITRYGKGVQAVVKEAQQMTMKEAIEVGLRTAQSTVPVDTGKLKASLQEIPPDAFGTDVEYAGYVEGTQPFMKPAVEAMKNALAGIWHDSVQRSS